MKKFITMAAVAFTAILAGCAPQEEFKIALVTDVGDIDDASFNQGSWEGVVEFAEANDKTYSYYKPTTVNTDEYLSTIELAIENGAEVIVTPGFLFEAPIFYAQDEFPDVSFILLDGVPNDGNWGGPNGPEFRQEDNVASILYAEEQSGWLAGYAAVADGYRKLGFMGGMAVPAVVKFGIGFAQGAEAAAIDLGLVSIPETSPIEIRYHYTGDFTASPENAAIAETMFQQGTEVIFAAGGAVAFSVAKEAEEAGKNMIGVDVDQVGLSETVITSAMKGLTTSVVQTLEKFYNDEFPGGEITVLDATNNGVGLPTAEDSWKFENFTVAEYEEVYEDLAEGLYIVFDNSVYGVVNAEALEDLNADLDSVNLIWVD
jgi:basic membrane protein A